MKHIDFYGFCYDWLFPISFFLFILTLLLSGIYHSELIFMIGSASLILIDLCGIFYLFVNFRDIKKWITTPSSYKLTDDEHKLWESIKRKAFDGYNEWFARTKGDDLCGPWIKDYTPEENELLEKIHKIFFGDDWYITMPISGAQVNYVMYEDVKNKVR